MKDNPFYQVSGEVIVAAETSPGTYSVWQTYCEDPTYWGDLCFDSIGLIHNMYTREELSDLVANTWTPVVSRTLDGRVNRLMSIAL